MGEISIEELVEIPDLKKIDLDSVVVEVDGLSGVPAPSLIEKLRAGEICVRYGKDPVTNELICLVWA